MSNGERGLSAPKRKPRKELEKSISKVIRDHKKLYAKWRKQREISEAAVRAWAGERD